MSSIPSELEQLYLRYFGNKPKVVLPKDVPPTSYTSKSGMLSTRFLGVEIWLPVTLIGLPNEIGDNGKLFLPYCTVRIAGSSDFIKTPMNLQRGSVKELFSMDDYVINIKGFFIDKQNRSFPEEEIINLKKMHEAGASFMIDNAITNIFLGTPGYGDTDHVVMTKFDMPEVTGGKKSMRPFSMELLSDCVFILELA